MPPQNLVYLFSAYTVVWIVLFGYMVYLQGQLGDLKSQVNALRKRLETAKPQLGKPETTEQRDR